MTTAIAIPGNAATTFLTHFFGGGLADGDIRRCTGEQPAATKKGRRKARHVTAIREPGEQGEPGPVPCHLAIVRSAQLSSPALPRLLVGARIGRRSAR